jgi:tRNA(Ile)-lysidine synthase TilS/MesJ
MTLLVAVSAPGQEMSAEAWDELRGLQAQVLEGRDDVVKANLMLTEAEAKAFWPVYEEYRAAANQVQERTAKLVEAYAANVEDMNDTKAAAFFEEWLAVDRQELKMRETYATKVRAVLPARKAVRFFQIENKLDAIMRLDAAMRIPLVE